jgi:hypothetical protein
MEKVPYDEKKEPVAASDDPVPAYDQEEGSSEAIAALVAEGAEVTACECRRRDQSN